MVRKYSRRKISWSEAAVLLDGTLPNIPNHGCETLTKELEKSPIRLLKTQKKERNQILQKSKSGKEIFWSHLERQNSSKAITTLNSRDVHHKRHLCAYRPWQYFYFRKTITLYSVRKRNCGHDCNNMHHVHVKFYPKTIIGKGCSRHKVLKNQNSLIQCLRDHTHNRFQFIF